MRYIIILVVSWLYASPLLAQYVEISGKVQQGIEVRNNLVGLFVVEEGDIKLQSTVPIKTDGSFSILLKPTYEGFYAVGYSSQKVGNNFKHIYLKKDEVVEVQMDSTRIYFVGTPSPENKLLEEWDNMNATVRNQALDHLSMNLNYTNKEFFTNLDNLVRSSKDYIKRIQTNNEHFNRLMKRMVGVDLDYFATSYISSERHKNAINLAEYADYYRTIDKNNRYPTDDILQFFNGSNAMYSYVKFAIGKDAGIDAQLKVLGTDRQKGAYLTSRILPKLKEYTVFEDISLKYGHLFQKERQKELVGETNARLFDTRGGAKAMNFTLPDVADKMVSLTDFVGNIVVVDLWATWCGPCKAEVPHWKTLIEQFKGKPVVFLGVSIDQDKDKEKWLKMVKEEGISGIQLFAGSNSKIARDYQVRSIPRYMVFDQKGNIVSVDAPRPSERYLKEMIDARLK